VPKNPTYWVRSSQTRETSRKQVPAQFNTLKEAKQYRRELNLHRGAYHPGYFIEKQDDNPSSFYAWPGRS